MYRQFATMLAYVLIALPAVADNGITEAQIRQVIAATDSAAMQRNTAAIGEYLGESFLKVVEFPYKKYMAKVKLNRTQFLALLDAGWPEISDYQYQRDDLEIHIQADGRSGESWSTITEHTVRNGVPMVSRVREYATYELENDLPVITRISGLTLVGDTSPEYQ